jgi:hypothetical protein
MTFLQAAFRRSFRPLLRIARAMMREVFDESAYARFLERRQLATSPRAYSEFLQENEISRARRPRCC